MSLLEDVLKQEITPKLNQVSDEQIEVAIAWAEGKVSTGACAGVGEKAY